MYRFSFHNPVATFVGTGQFELAQDRYVGKRVLLLSGSVVSKLPQYQSIRTLLGTRVVGEYTAVPPNPDVFAVDEIVALLHQSQADTVIGIGGGSTLDAAKMAAAICGEAVPTEAYLSGKPLPEQRPVKLVLLPTTAGTGSEVTNNAVITSGVQKRKIAQVGDALFCDAAVIDPELFRTVPTRVATASGFDALCHAIESLWSTNAMPPSDALAMAAIERIVANLEQACGGDAHAQEEMAIASCLAGMAFTQTRVNICHANSYYLTQHYGLDHGAACAVTLVPALRYNLDATRGKLDAAARQCGLSSAEDLIDEIERMYRSLDMKEHLSDYGVTEDDILPMADAIMANPISAFNPVPLTREALAQLLHQIL